MNLAGEEGEITFEKDPYRAADGASAIVLVVEWEEFKTLNCTDIYKRMKKPALIFDGRNILEQSETF